MNFATLDLNLLRVLDTLLREGSTVRAGERLGLSQPAVSAALGRLRHALGDPLFLRKGGGLIPTDYAVSIALPLRAALDRIETVLAQPSRFDPLTSDQSFKISGSDFFAEMLMPRLADTLQTRAPGMRVQLVDLVPDSYIDTLERYEVDLALIPSTTFPDWTDHQAVFTSPFSVIARTGNPRIAAAGIAPGGTIPLDLFCALGHVLFSPEGNLSAMGDAALARVGRQRRVVMTMPFFTGVARAVAESDLIALMPAQLADHFAPRMGLAVYGPPMPVPEAHLVMFWHKRSTQNPAHRWLRALIADLLAPLDAPQDGRP
ncbi:LysR family transcriptional regulator [Oceaniglobus roseus]|uniref:LysR family transcriptional regulator n=1 Tax=Oceaniglobus roseus TaxID=1737570 RepID=UPI000C7F32D0|nr:LysR family transcriptional regulator [Kandeliimicrobium roseum]